MWHRAELLCMRASNHRGWASRVFSWHKYHDGGNRPGGYRNPNGCAHIPQNPHHVCCVACVTALTDAGTLCASVPEKPFRSGKALA